MFVTWTCYAVLTRVHLDWTILYLCRYLTVKLEYQWQAGKKLCHARNGLPEDFKYKKNGRKDLEDKNYLLITGIFGTSLTWLHDDCTVILFIYSVEILLDVMYICRQLYKQPVSAICDALGWKGKVLCCIWGCHPWLWLLVSTLSSRSSPLSWGSDDGKKCLLWNLTLALLRDSDHDVLRSLISHHNRVLLSETCSANAHVHERAWGSQCREKYLNIFKRSKFPPPLFLSW